MLVDTNVVSVLIRKSSDPAVTRWVADQHLETLYFSAIGEVELRFSVSILPPGQRRNTLLSKIELMLREAFENRVLSFDSEAARRYADIAAARRSAGYGVATADCQVAAIAHSRGMTVATRNIRDFEGTGIKVVNPWTAI